jgi:hypothetical protein
MKDKIKQIQQAIALLNSMIESGEVHTDHSRRIRNIALSNLKELYAAELLKDFQVWHNSDSCVEIDDVTIDEYLQSRTTKNK